jgi:hypothetical protein
MAGRLRWRPASHPNLLGGLAAAGLLAALITTSHWLSSGLNSGQGHPTVPRGPSDAAGGPYRIGESFVCPLDRPVPAMSDRHSYPPGHPARPPATASPTACYQTAEQAAAAGYPPAPLPPGALEVGGVYLTPTGQGFRARCQQVARHLGFTIPCPGLLPTLAPDTVPPGLCDQPSLCTRGQGFLFHWAGFEVPAGYVGAQRLAQGILEVLAAPARARTGGLPLACAGEQPIATPVVAGVRAVLVVCAEGPLFGRSVLLRWSKRGTLVVVNLQGWSTVNQQLAVTVARHLRLVQADR